MQVLCVAVCTAEWLCHPCSEELRRPENKGIKPYIDKLKQAKKAIDEGGAAVGKLALGALGCSCIKSGRDAELS